jgi:hypothetical protein
LRKKLLHTLLNSSLKVVPIETLSKTASIATFANRFCSVKEIPNFSKVFNNSGSTSFKSLSFFCDLEQNNKLNLDN